MKENETRWYSMKFFYEGGIITLTNMPFIELATKLCIQVRYHMSTISMGFFLIVDTFSISDTHTKRNIFVITAYTFLSFMSLCLSVCLSLSMYTCLYASVCV